MDILYLHGPGRHDLNDCVFDFFADQKAKGRITFSGVNSFDNAILQRVATTPIDAVMLQYNVGDLRNSSELDRLHAAGKIVVSGDCPKVRQNSISPPSFIPRNKTSLWYLMRMLRKEPGFVWNGYKLRKRLIATGNSPVEAAIQFVTGNTTFSTSLARRNLEHARFNARAGHRTSERAPRETFLG